MGVWSVVEGDGAFLDACGGDSSRRCSSKRCLMSFGDPLLRGEIGLGAGRDGPGRQRGSASALEEMGLDAKGGPLALWRKWEWTLGEVHLGAGGSRLGATVGSPWSWRRWDWIFGESASGRLGRCCGRVCIWIKRTASHGSRFNGHRHAILLKETRLRTTLRHAIQIFLEKVVASCFELRYS